MEHGRIRLGYFHKATHVTRYPGYYRIEIEDLPAATWVEGDEPPSVVDVTVRAEWVPERVEGQSHWVEES